MLYDILPPLAFFTSFGGIIVLVSRVSMRIRREQLSETIQKTGAAEPTGKAESFFSPQTQNLTLARNRLALVPQMLKSSIVQAKSSLADRKQRREERRQQALEHSYEEPASDVSTPVTQAEETQDIEGDNQIIMPTSGWRQKLAHFSEKGKNIFGEAKNKVSTTIPKRVRLGTPKPVTSPIGGVPIMRTLELEEDQITNDETQGVVPKPQVRVTRTTSSQPAVPPQSALQAEAALEPQPVKKEKRLFALPRREYKQDTPLAQAAAAMEQAEFTKAEDILVPYIVQHARDKDAYVLLGRAAIGREAWSEAVEIFQQVLRIDSAAIGVQASLGYAALKSGKMTVALQALQRAHDEDPTDIEVLQQLLTIARRMDNKVLERSVLHDMEVVNPPEKQVQVQG